jgi:hypothetical protein
MVPKHELLKNNPLHAQELNYETNVCELKDHELGKKDWNET